MPRFSPMAQGLCTKKQLSAHSCRGGAMAQAIECTSVTDWLPAPHFPCLKPSLQPDLSTLLICAVLATFSTLAQPLLHPIF
jgi:hypothetical protein